MTPTRGQAATQPCRYCGRPRAADAAPCLYCGKTPAVDEASVAAARAHEVRLQRMSRPLRAMLMPELVRRVHASFLKGEFEGRVPLSELGVRLWKWHPALPEATPYIVGVVAWLGSIVWAISLIFRVHPAVGVNALAFVVVGAVAFPAMYLAWKVLGIANLYAAFADAAADLADLMEKRVPVHCPQCGGHTAVVLVGVREAAPCPWCDAPLDLPQEHGWIQAAGRSLEKRYAGSLDAFVASISGRKKPGAPAGGVQLPESYEFEGFVVFGTARGFLVREYAETSSFAGGRVEHIELVGSTGLPGEALWTRPQMEVSVRRVATLFRVRLPQSVNGRVDSRGWFHETAPRLRVPALPELNTLLDRLKPHGALLIDPGGVTAWRFRSGAESGGGPKMAAFHDELAALVLALRASARQPGGPGS